MPSSSLLKAPPVKSLTVAGEGNADFPVMLSAAGFSSISSWSRYRDLGSLLAVVSNVGTRPIRAYSVIWRVEDGAGIPRPMHVKFFDRHSMPRKGTQSLNPGDKRLIFPFGNLTGSAYSDPEKLTAFFPVTVPWLGGNVISVSVDCVIHSDGSTTGQDLFELRESFVAARHAEHDSGVAMRAYLRENPGVTANIIDQELQRRAEQGVRTQGSSITSRYWRARGQEAQNLRAVLQGGSTSAFEQST